MSLERDIQRQLTRLDDQLILDKEWSPFGYIFYSVKYPDGIGGMLTVLEWRDGRGPYPLSTSIIDAVQRQEGDVRDAIKTSIVNNAVRKERMREQRHQEMDDIAREFQKSSKRHYVLPPKGVSRLSD